MKIPRNLNEAVDQLYRDLSGTDKELLKSSGLNWFSGMNIRNGFKLWEPGTSLHEWFKKRGLFHADDMSSVIISALTARIKGSSFELATEVKHYQDYWDRHPGTPEYIENQEAKCRSVCSIPFSTPGVKKPWWKIW